MDSTGPAFEFNWGAIPNVQLHTIISLGSIVPSNNSAYFPAGKGPNAFGLTDMETGIKWAWIKETKHWPQIGTFTMFELPTGSYSKGLGVGKVWYKVPLWLQKNIGPWTLDGGAGENYRAANSIQKLSLWQLPGQARHHSQQARAGSRGRLTWC